MDRDDPDRRRCGRRGVDCREDVAKEPPGGVDELVGWPDLVAFGGVGHASGADPVDAGTVAAQGGGEHIEVWRDAAPITRARTAAWAQEQDPHRLLSAWLAP